MKLVSTFDYFVCFPLTVASAITSAIFQLFFQWFVVIRYVVMERSNISIGSQVERQLENGRTRKTVLWSDWKWQLLTVYKVTMGWYYLVGICK